MSADAVAAPTDAPAGAAEPVREGVAITGGALTFAVRFFSWGTVAALLVFLVNNYLTFWQGWPGADSVAATFGLGNGQGTPGTFGWLQFLAYPALLALTAVLVVSSTGRTLRVEAASLSDLSAWVIRVAFWIVFLVGLADMVISFARVEGLLPAWTTPELAQKLGRSTFRGTYVHMPLVGVALILASITRGITFIWLALLVVVAEFAIVITRFIFSYEQAFMGDLVRFWYAALFLFASAYTLLEEGHVRVDVVYASFKRKTRGYINAWGSLLLGLPLCWSILIVGMGNKASLINSPLLIFEVSQSGFGMYVKYLMAGFIAIFAISMMIQFVSYLCDSVAEIRDEPGGRAPAEEVVH
ncbi:MAG: TRAP transporter small permease subunit [Pseudomonadota bacterium]